MNDSARTALRQVKQFLVVSIVTVLIWLLAEAESVRTQKIPLDLTFKPDQDATRLVSLGSDRGPIVSTTVTLQGPAARVDALADKLRSKLIAVQAGMEGVPVEPGRRVIDLREVLRGLPAVRDSRIAIAQVEPETVQVDVDNLVTRDARVRPVVPDGQVLEGSPEPTPATVRLRFPESAAGKVPEDLSLPARIDRSSLTNLPEGRRTIIKNVPVEIPEALRGLDGVRLQPASVSVAVTLRSRASSAVLATVPVHVRLAPTETGMWDIQVPPESRLLTDVAVTGPSEDIEQIRSGRLKPIAFVPLSFEELEKAAASGQPIEKEPIFSELPTPLRFEAKQKTIRILVKRREPAPAAPKTSTGG